MLRLVTGALILLALLSSLAVAGLAYDYPIPIQRGNGLANVFAKLNSGQSVTIAYLGGSVTEMIGWRSNVTSWFASRYPGKITEVNAGWSGTGSLIGAMRIQRDVIARHPDLVFVEFAVNDLPEDQPLFIRRNCEGIARQVWSDNAMADICFVETIAYYTEQPYLSGYYPNTVQAHYDVCDAYGIPSVNVGWALYERVLAGTPWTDLAPDRVHPNSAGSQVYSDAVIAYLETERTRGAPSVAHTLLTSITDFPVTGSTATSAVSVSPIPSGWAAHYNEYGVSSFVQSTSLNAPITIPFAGPAAAVKIIVSPDSGTIAYSIDGGAYATTTPSLNGYTYLWAFPIAKTLANGAHTVTFKAISGVARLINVEAATTSTGGMNSNVPGGDNIARKATRCSTDSDYGPYNTGIKAIDGLASTKWTSLGTSPVHWLALDLGGMRTVNGFIIRHATTGGDPLYLNTKAFRVQSASSMDGPWIDDAVVDNSSQAGVTYRSYTVPKSLRYVRLYITNPGTDNFARIPEFEVRGTSDGMNDDTPLGVNLARTAVSWAADSNYSSSFNGAKAIDGVISGGSKWTTTNTPPPHWLALDLGGTKMVNGFIVRHAGAGGEETYYNTKNFSLQSAPSISGPWTDECVVDNSAQASVTTRSYNFPKPMRYVRLYITNAGIDNYARIPEFEVWGSTYDSLPQVRSLSDNVQVALSDKVVTAVFSDCFFVEEPSRCSGMRCVVSSASVSPGDRVNVIGRTATVNGEKVLSSVVYSVMGNLGSLRPLGMIGRTSQLLEPVPHGLYVTMWGRVTAAGSGYFVMDDGSGAQSSRSVWGVEVRSSLGVTVGQYVRATGALCRETANGLPATVLRAEMGGLSAASDP